MNHAGIISELTHDMRNAAIAHSAYNPACAAYVLGYAATVGGGGFRLASPGNTHCPYNACTAHATCLATRRGATCSLRCAFDAAAAVPSTLPPPPAEPTTADPPSAPL
jgi:hypothetical protein